LGLGVPAGAQVILEVAAFTCAAIMMGWISETALAAHQVAISVASTTFMLPLGLSMALAIRVGHAIGANDLVRARRSIHGALLATTCTMTLTAITICLFTRPLAALFVKDHEVLLIVCAGALRGLHDVRVPTLINACGYWLVGLPLSYLLGFHSLVGTEGIWMGLMTALAVVSGLLLARLFLALRARERRLI
jgi:MATE family multidrug resistance protein